MLSIYAGTLSVKDKSAHSGMVTLSGSFSGLTSDITEVSEEGVVSYEGSKLQFSAANASLYLTANVCEYQKYSVQMELFD